VLLIALSPLSFQMRKGALVRVHDGVPLAPGSGHKSLLVAEKTTAKEVVSILLRCHGAVGALADDYRLYEERAECYRRRLGPDDRPAQVQGLWPSGGGFRFVLRRCGSAAGLGMQPVTPIPPFPNGSHLPPSPEADEAASDDEVEPMEVSSASSSGGSDGWGARMEGRPLPPPPVNFKLPAYSRESIYDGLRVVSGLRTYTSLQSTKAPPRYVNLPLPPERTLTSIHESGLPPPPPPRPRVSLSPPSRQSSLLMLPANQRASIGSLSTGSNCSSNGSSAGVLAPHEYENYFYI